MVGGMCDRGHAWQGWGRVQQGASVVGGHVWQGACMAGRACMAGACMAGGCVWQGACMARETATAADGTHPTGMHSCCLSVNAVLVH